jgi:hypothetical protein
MKKKLKDLFTEDVQKILTQETLDALEEAVVTKTELAVEAALLEQDELYAEKLQQLVKSIDQDHTNKMRRIVESIDKDQSAKLIKVVKKYEREQSKDLHKFKKSIVESVGAFLDEFINESLPTEDFSQAVKNKTAYNVLENLRQVLAIDSAVMKESVASAIYEGKTELEKLRKENAQIKKNFKIIKEAKEQAEKKLFIESKVAKLPEAKRKFVTKALSDKPLDFIKENFDYTVRLFDKQEKRTLETIKEEAIKDRKIKPDYVKPEKTLTEKVNKEEDQYDPYVAVMEQMRF